jgi:hypothetical protein
MQGKYVILDWLGNQIISNTNEKKLHTILQKKKFWIGYKIHSRSFTIIE